MGSSRFPGKPLAPVLGKPLVEWVWRRARAVKGASRVIVATDSEAVAEAVRRFGGEAVRTGSHATGTDRVAEVARRLEEPVVVNLQGDEPVIPEGLVEALVERLWRTGADVATPAHWIDASEEIADPNVVKVVVDGRGRALYFSRSPIPYGARRVPPSGEESERALRHVGVYAFRREALLRFAELPRSPLEKSEGLEQLRWMEAGGTIEVVLVDRPTVGVDRPEDLKKVEALLSASYTGPEGFPPENEITQDRPPGGEEVS
jgi:3-deoxy-manno-octulosonate cytidylyltransferase (CMP-KDO synthetase)